MLTLTEDHENRYTAYDGKLYLERRPTLSPYWQVRTSFHSRQITRTTKCRDIRSAAEWAEKWFIGIQAKLINGEPIETRYTLTYAYNAFIAHHRKLIAIGESTANKVSRYEDTWNNIKDKLGTTDIARITYDTMNDFKDWRVERALNPENPKRRGRQLTGKTLNADIGLIRLVLTYAAKRSWLKTLPIFPTAQTKHVAPDWFSVEEYKHLVDISRQRCDAVKHHAHHYFERRELHAFILLMAHSCTRVDEALGLRWRDVKEAPENAKLKHFRTHTVQLRIEDGKVGERYALGMFGAVRALQILRELHPDAQPDDTLFATSHAQAFITLLDAAKLRTDAKGKLRNQKTLRHTSIMMRCLFNPHLSTAELATLAGTSFQSLEQYYLRHLKAAHVQKRLIDAALEAQ